MSYASLIGGTHYMQPKPEPAPPGTLELHFGSMHLGGAEACYAIMGDKGFVAGEYKVMAGEGCWGHWCIKRRGKAAFKRRVEERRTTQDSGSAKPAPALREIVDPEKYTTHLEAEIDRLLERSPASY